MHSEPNKSRQLGIAFGLSFQLVVSVILGMYFGSLIDGKYETQPLGSLAGAILGFIAGMLPLLRLHKKMED